MLTKIRNAFLTGIAVIFPAAITIIIIRFLFVNINSWILNPLVKILRPYLSGQYVIHVAKIGIFLAVIIVISLIGWAANIIVLRKFFGMWERVFLKIPMFGRIYYAVKQISTAFLGHGKTIFKEVVLVEYPRKGVYSIGFVTGNGKGEIQAKISGELFNIFVPTTPNPTSGVFLIVPKGEIKFLTMSVEEGMKLVISGGAVTPIFENGQKE